MIVDITGLIQFFRRPDGSEWMTKPYVYDKVHSRKMPHIKEGKKLLFDTDEVEAYYKSFSVPTDEDIRSAVLTGILKNK